VRTGIYIHALPSAVCSYVIFSTQVARGFLKHNAIAALAVALMLLNGTGGSAGVFPIFANRCSLKRHAWALAVAFLTLLGFDGAAAQDPLGRDTPQSSVQAFLAACRSQDYQRAWRYFDLRAEPAGVRVKHGVELAQQLERVLERDPQFDLAALSKSSEGSHPGSNRERVDSFTVDGKTEDLELLRVTLRSGASVWVFSPGSMDLIPKLARALSDSPIEKYLPAPLVNWTLVDTPLWRWFALLLLTIACAAIARWLSRVAVVCLDPALKRFAPRLNTSLLNLFAAPLALLFGVAGFRALAAGIGPSTELWIALNRVTGLVLFSALAWLGMRIVDAGVVHTRRILVHHQTFAYSILPLTSRVVKILVAAVALTAVLSTWGYNTSAIVAGLGIGGVALALAAQKTVENLFGSVALVADRPVRVGDFCRFGDQSGTVEDIGLRSTRLRTPSRTLLTVPNGLFSTMTVENFSVRDKMWFHLTLNLRRDTTSAQVRTLLESVKDILDRTPKVETGIIPVRFVGVGTYSLDLEIFTYVVTRDSDEFLHIQQELFLAILDAVEAAGTALAVPTQAYYAITRGSSPISTTPRETS